MKKCRWDKKKNIKHGKKRTRNAEGNAEGNAERKCGEKTKRKLHCAHSYFMPSSRASKIPISAHFAHPLHVLTHSPYFSVSCILFGLCLLLCGLCLSSYLHIRFLTELDEQLIVGPGMKNYDTFVSNWNGGEHGNENRDFYLNNNHDLSQNKKMNQKNLRNSVVKKFWLFNVTNEDEWMKGEKLNVQEIGPFEYREWYEKYDIMYEDGKVSYKTWNWFTLDYASVDMNLNVTVLNMPRFLTLGSVNSEMVYSALNFFSNGDSTDVFVTVTIQQAIWGWESKVYDAVVTLDPAVQLNTYYGGYGNNQTAPNPDAVPDVLFTGSSDNTLIQHYYKYQNFSDVELCFTPRCPDHPRSLPWNSTFANAVYGSNGKQYHYYISPEDVLNFFYPYFLRSVPLLYQYNYVFHSLNLYRYFIDDAPYQNASILPSNAPFTNYGPYGVVNMTLTLNGAQLFISKPYFMDADSSYTSQVTGLRFVAAGTIDYETYFDIEPVTGSVVAGYARTQINALLQPIVLQGKVLFNCTPTMVPLVWVEEGGSITSDDAEDLASSLKLVADSIHYIFLVGVIAGSIFMFIGACIFLRAYLYRAAHEIPFWKFSDSDPEDVATISHPGKSLASTPQAYTPLDVNQPYQSSSNAHNI